MLSIVDGFKKLSEAAHGKRLGIPDSLISRREIVGGATIAGGVLGLIGLAVPALGIPAVGIIIGIVMLVIAFAFVELVAPSVGMWINRSILGYHRGQLAEFKNADEERASLDMVFRGVTVELTWENALNAGPAVMPHMMPAEQQPARVSGYPAIASQNEPEYTAKRIALKVTVPKLEEVYLSMTMVAKKEEWLSDKELYKYEFGKNGDTENLKRLRSGDDATHHDFPAVGVKDNAYEIEVVRSYLSSEIGDAVNLALVFQGGANNGDRKQAVFEMYL